MENNKKKEVFYGVVAVATLIVAMIGATLAYFSITAGSNEGAINATAANVSISYNDGQQVTAQADELIPSDFSVVQKAFTRSKENFGTEGALADNVCIDNNNRQVCSIYRFSISSDGERQISAYLLNESNEFTTGLSYALYHTNGNYTCEDSEIVGFEGSTNEEKREACVESKKWIVLDDNTARKYQTLNYCSNLDGDTSKYCSQVGLEKTYTSIATNSLFGYNAGGEVKTKTITNGLTDIYDLVIFLNETGVSQNVDQGKSYNGTILVRVTDSGAADGRITGTID